MPPSWGQRGFLRPHPPRTLKKHRKSSPLPEILRRASYKKDLDIMFCLHYINRSTIFSLHTLILVLILSKFGESFLLTCFYMNTRICIPLKWYRRGQEISMYNYITNIIANKLTSVIYDAPIIELDQKRVCLPNQTRSIIQIPYCRVYVRSHPNRY